ncbi:MAG: SH3 domain-containing protein [Devosia sp.]
MRFHKTIVSLAIAGTVLLGTAGAAMAAQAVATTNVNVRSGPSSSYRAVDTLRRNEVVNVTTCRGGWCYVEKAGPDGWVSANYLDSGRQYAAPRPYAAPKPSVSFSFGFGTPYDAPRPSRPSHGGWDNNDGGHHRGGWDNYGPRHR